MPALSLPTLHVNGTSRDGLAEPLVTALDAIRDAIHAMADVAPNGRDYYPQGQLALAEAQAQHKSRVERLASVRDELQQIAEHLV